MNPSTLTSDVSPKSWPLGLPHDARTAAAQQACIRSGRGRGRWLPLSIPAATLGVAAAAIAMALTR